MGRQLQIGRWELPSCVICDFPGWQNHRSSPLHPSHARGSRPLIAGGRRGAVHGCGAQCTQSINDLSSSKSK